MFAQVIRKLSILMWPVALAMISGCAGYGPSQSLINADREAVIERMGQPTREHPIESGSRLIYARGPYGKHTYFVDFNVDGRVSQWTQVLTEENFQRIKPGMTKAQVEEIIGPSFNRRELGRKRGEVWSYRYETPFCTWFEIEISLEGQVRSAGHGFPPECLRHRTRWMPGPISQVSLPLL